MSVWRRRDPFCARMICWIVLEARSVGLLEPLCKVIEGYCFGTVYNEAFSKYLIVEDCI